MKRKNKDKAPLPFAVRLPPELQERLRKAGGERGMGEEIRKRLEASFDAEEAPANAKTQELIDAISYFADETATHYGQWFEDAFAFEVLKASVESFLASARPRGDPVINPDRVDFVELTLGADLSPKDVSRIFVSDIRRARAKRADEGKRR